MRIFYVTVMILYKTFPISFSVVLLVWHCIGVGVRLSVQVLTNVISFSVHIDSHFLDLVLIF